MNHSLKATFGSCAYGGDDAEQAGFAMQDRVYELREQHCPAMSERERAKGEYHEHKDEPVLAQVAKSLQEVGENGPTGFAIFRRRARCSDPGGRPESNGIHHRGDYECRPDAGERDEETNHRGATEPS